MPSLFDALGNAAAGYTNEYNQTRSFNEQKRLDDAQLERQKMLDTQANEDRLRQRGIDPATGQPFILPPSLTQVAPGNKGQGPVGGTPEQQVAHYIALARFYSQNGDVNTANLYAQQAQAIDAQMKTAQSQQAQWDRMVYEREHPMPINSFEQWEIEHGGPPGSHQLSEYEKWEIAHGGTPGSIGSAKAKQLHTQAGQYYNDFKQLWNNVTHIPSASGGLPIIDPKTHKPISSIVDPATQQKLQQVFAHLDTSDTPGADAEHLLKTWGSKIDQNSAKAVELYGKYRQAIHDYEAATTSGGSDASGNFPPPSPWP